MTEVIVKELLASNKFSHVFRVIIRDKVCVMKVHRGRGPKMAIENPCRETNNFNCERNAYRRLTETGVCARGITPRFYGVIEKIDPAQCLPHLKSFVQDEYPPNAILMEYIADMEELDWSKYTDKRMQNFLDGMKAIQESLVQHDDIHPRNLMVVKGDLKRAIWIDFDRAQTLSGELTEQQKGWLDQDYRILKEMTDFMKDDFEEGKMNKTLQYYYY
ncbi:hypothetical protein FQN54_005665 [Arachnomyces sp. PD_36]|nr:hypothetical protein FQN54_005665 [Arachnomyces sp. PD_36]